ncbi:two-component system regulatory protein YycI [Fodinisporobacter ferrooxydans]|uniref:Two-component system regulatory protein YycI n=1 Tax=Fodinisporobacter ferrooxydans TaxID=2901836 RepID=A0ABY4CNZ5_9BACL|nr:two-component system regulatory protein YycI [Alicyclobacillaceae bacterium MYW30-H2]
MDWSKAKNYLIITFLFLDLLLGYQWWTIRHQASVYVDSFADEVASVKDLLATEHIRVKADIPKDTPTLSFLRARYKTLNMEKIAQTVLGHAKPTEVDQATQHVIQYQGDHGEMLVLAPGSYRASWHTGDQIVVGNIEKANVLAKISPALTDQLWDGNQFKKDYATVDNQGTGTAYYSMQYQGYPIFPAMLAIELDHGKITGYQETLLDVTEEEGMKKRQVLSAVSALRSLATSFTSSSKNSLSSIEIRNIRLGYYGKPYNEDDWYLTPMWRFVTNTTTFYVNAITGEVESTR